ncbi:MAG: ATP-dependent DNA helicase, partial [Desulfocucumaceae bacterium]
FIYNCSDDSFVYWITIGGQGEGFFATLSAAPVRVGELLYDRLYSSAGPVIMTSATLTTNGSFDFFAERAGVSRVADIKVIKKSIESPFVYERQSLLCLINNLPVQGQEADRKYIKNIGGALEELIITLGGKALVLFTSHKVLREVYSQLKEGLEEKGISTLGHNIDGNRSRMVEEFIRLDRAVLMGSASFWEGVDIPGDSLTSVVIVKLPFPSPSAPVIEARMEDLAAVGRSAFKEYYLPMAVIRFKQGFGRLIRTEKDRGVVVVLDRRIVDKGYGRQFLHSLPLKDSFRGDLDSVKEKIDQWVNGDDGMTE